MHKKIGIIGGLSPESTISYYRYLVANLENPEIIIYSVNMKQYHRWRDDDRWDLIINDLASIAEYLKSCGATIGLIATNSMHKVFNEVQAKTKLKLIHIADATAKAVKKEGIKTVGLLGTRFTMNEDFYVSRLAKQGLCVKIPNKEDQEIMHSIIFNELIFGEFKSESKRYYLNVIDKLKSQGAQGIILGCTEIPLLLKNESCDITLFDTAKIHVSELI